MNNINAHLYRQNIYFDTACRWASKYIMTRPNITHYFDLVNMTHTSNTFVKQSGDTLWQIYHNLNSQTMHTNVDLPVKLFDVNCEYSRRMDFANDKKQISTIHSIAVTIGIN